ncbi:MAG: nucleotidyltransferase domain-containing protein [Candidatus Methanoplasma sp.]|jgi:predicted nucleotidyltransferase|nr:nucleotidyltransferase domain-containing protein [Candidatus Methanoplasma sp.]
MDIEDIVFTRDLTFEEMCSIVRRVAEKYDIEHIYLFGSRARGDHSSDSDYDFCVSFGQTKDPLQMCNLICELESALNKGVDVVGEHVLRPEVLKEVLTDGKLVYGTRS